MLITVITAIQRSLLVISPFIHILMHVACTITLYHDIEHEHEHIIDSPPH